MLKRMNVLLLCSTCMFKALSLLQGFMVCYFLHLLLMNLMLYVAHTLFNMYLILFPFIVNTNYYGEISAYSTSHIISKVSACRISYGQSQTVHSCDRSF